MKTNKLFKFIAMGLLVSSVATLSGCGSSSDTVPNAGGSTANASVAGASSTNTTTTTPAPTPSGSVSAGGDLPILPFAITGNGPHNSTVIPVAVGNSNDIGIDSVLELKVDFGSAIQSTSSTGAQVGKTDNYNKLRFDLTLVVDGTDVDTRTFTVTNGMTTLVDGQNYANYNEVVKNYIYQKGNRTIGFKIKNLRSSWKLDTGWCLGNYVSVTSYFQPNSSCYPSGNGSSWYCPNCYNNNGTWYCYDVQTYNTCYNNVNPVGSVLSGSTSNDVTGQGWSFTLKVRSDSRRQF